MNLNLKLQITSHYHTRLTLKSCRCLGWIGFWIFQVWIEYFKCIELRRRISEKVKIFQQHIRAQRGLCTSQREFSYDNFSFCLFQMGRLWRPLCCIAVKDVQWLRHGPKKFFESGRLVPWVATNQHQQTWLQTKGRYRRQSCLSLYQTEITIGWLTIFRTLLDKKKHKRQKHNWSISGTCVWLICFR